MADAVVKQLGNFIGEFIEYDSAAVQLRYKRIMRVRVKVDVRKPIKRKKRIALKNDESVYVKFEVLQPQLVEVFKWDISLRAQSRINQSWKSKWLVEDDEEKQANFGNTGSMG
ncbi:hypothetical protein Goshw_003678 [Gossypium schwendimanii]|uniref:Uncharacterized protein n=1 Tax=Gossypium schwendimanii TaxID=34291 RepID=A0A7J9N046_GOSSC|nr:hypothetical protein [Gossypium schwendimanii]